MKRILCLGIVVTLAGLLSLSGPAHAQEKAAGQRYEYAVVKWDGPDRLFYNLPDKFELVHLEKTGVTIPREAQNEEFCLAVAANKMAREGWEALNLDSRRILFRRAVAK